MTVAQCRLNPDTPRRLTVAERERLAKARIDYSDIPELGEAFFATAKQAPAVSTSSSPTP
jgi:hypothetical protein